MTEVLTKSIMMFGPWINEENATGQLKVTGKKAIEYAVGVV